MNVSKIIKATWSGRKFTRTAPITQWDYGYLLQIEGVELPASYEIDFSNTRETGDALKVLGDENGAEIPQELIETGKDIYAFYYHVEDGFGKTVRTWQIPNQLRAKRTEETPTPAQQSIIDQAISALNSAVEQTAQDVIDAGDSAQDAKDYAGMAEDAKVDAQNFATQAEQSATDAQTSYENLTEYGNQALSELNRITDDVQTYAGTAQTAAEEADAKANSILSLTASAQTLPAGSSASASYNAQTGVMSFGIPKGDRGDKGDKGDTGATGAKGEQGERGLTGQDGISPTVTITPITGGHRITITDADGEHSADVIDGHNGMVTEYVTGTTPTITAQADTRYVCGEVATLDFTSSASGICDVVFTSGSTPTILTVPNTVRWANGFDPTALDANTTYEINIMDGLGVAVGWT